MPSPAPRLPGDSGFAFDRLKRSREKPPSMPPEAEQALKDFAAIPAPPEGGAPEGGAPEGGAPEGGAAPADDAATLAEKLHISPEDAREYLMIAQKHPETKDLDAAGLADKLGSDYGLMKKFARECAQAKMGAPAHADKEKPAEEPKEEEPNDKEEEPLTSGEE